MAFPVWRRATKKVYVYYHEHVTNKTVQLPRKQTAHLDGLPEVEVLQWVSKWEKQHGVSKERSDRVNLKETDKLNTLWMQYQTHRNMNRGRRDITSNAEDEMFRNHIVGFFVGKHSVKLPAKWHPLMADFHAHLFKLKLATRTIQKILWTLERFGKHLVWQRYMEYPFTVSIPVSKNTKVTPLKTRMTPDAVLNFVKSNPVYTNPEIDYNLAILLGYFAALGPGELFGLSKSDFLTGKNAESNTKTLKGFRTHNLGSKLSVIINKTMPSKGKQTEPVPLLKNDFREGVVNIWNTDAARMIAEIVMSRPEGRLFPFSYGHLVRRWRENVKKVLDVTSHDLRRASCLYLGRTVRIDLTLLQEHMRHAEIETTILYTREPSSPDIKLVDEQDFDDVA